MKFILLWAMLIAPLTLNAATASWYGNQFHGRKTANGETFNQWGLTTASNSHKMGTKLLVANPSNGKSVTVRVTDKGGFSKYGRTLDLSRGAFMRIANPNQGIIKVTIIAL